MLWLYTSAGADPDRPMPSYFPDLHLDEVVDGILAGLDGRDAESIRTAYYRRLPARDEVRYRQEVFSDLERPDLRAAVSAFADGMKNVRRMLEMAAAVRHPPQAGRWHLDAASGYVEAVQQLAHALADGRPASRAMSAIAAYVANLAASARIEELRLEAARVRQRMSSIRYDVNVRAGRITVTEPGDDADYADAIQRTFARFDQVTPRDYRVPIRERERLDQVEERVLDAVAKLFAPEFGELEHFCTKWRDFVDPVIDCFHRDVQFYLAYLAWTEPFRSAGLPMCYPEVASRPDASFAYDSFELALGHKIVLGGGTVVTNDFSLGPGERILVITGPNRGGKTTFARLFGQLHHLAALGCPVPGTAARLRLCDEIFTQFSRKEDLRSARGRLEDDLRRMQEILVGASADSVLVVNEIFTSATLRDASFLGRKVLERACEIGLAGVYVTFADELASLSASTVSMVSTVDHCEPERRTFKVVRRPADGHAYAVAIAHKYGLSYEQLVGDLGR